MADEKLDVPQVVELMPGKVPAIAVDGPRRSIPPTTTFEQNLSTAGQRRVNLIWEFTQSFIAATVTLATLVTATVLTLRSDVNVAAFVLMSNAFFLVVGFYFGRTNHQRTGGTGAAPPPPGGGYEGR